MARWLEILSPFSYQLEHRAGKLHDNADGLSRRTPCLDCTQCAAIEKRDGGLSRAEMEAELQQIREIQAKNPVARDQATGEHPVAKIYRTLQTGEPLSAEKLQLGGTELKRLYAKKEALRIRTDDVLKIRRVQNEKVHWCVVCPTFIRKTVIWETHGLAHSGMNRTVARLQLAWYWPGMGEFESLNLNLCTVIVVRLWKMELLLSKRQRFFGGSVWCITLEYHRS